MSKSEEKQSEALKVLDQIFLNGYATAIADAEATYNALNSVLEHTERTVLAGLISGLKETLNKLKQDMKRD